MKYIIACLIIISFCFEGFSQGQSIEKEVVCGGEVEIGLEEGKGNFCYKWSPTEGLDDPNSFRTMARPLGDTTYTLTITSEDFFYKEKVLTVHVKVTPLKRFTIEPTQCCWKKGESITADQFKIGVVPSDFSGEVLFEPNVAPAAFALGATGQVKIKVIARCNDVEKTKEIYITVVDEDFEVSIPGADGGVKWDPLQSVLEELKIGPCKPTFEFTGGLISVKSVYKCCPMETPFVKNLRKTGNSVGMSAGLSCEFPISGFPYVASANVVVGGGFDVSLGGETEDFCESEKLCIAAKMSTNLQVGIELEILDDDVVNAALIGVPSVEFPLIKYCRDDDRWDFGDGGVCWKVDIEGSITLLSFMSEKVSYNLVSQRCF